MRHSRGTCRDGTGELWRPAQGQLEGVCDTHTEFCRQPGSPSEVGAVCHNGVGWILLARLSLLSAILCVSAQFTDCSGKGGEGKLKRRLSSQECFTALTGDRSSVPGTRNHL